MDDQSGRNSLTGLSPDESEVLSELLESEVPSEEPVESDVLFDVPELSAVELYASPFAEVSEVPVKLSVVV